MTEEELISRYGKEKVEAWKKAFQNATIRNDFIFCKAMQNMNICKEVLCLFLQDTIEIKSITPQSTIDSFLKSKAVRLDVLVEDRNGNHYDIEMQVVISDSIAKRMRMYQASIDVSTFEKGKDYKQAKKTIIIFICMSDPIGRGLPIYTFKNLCVEDPNIELGDETLKLIVVPQNWQKVRNNDGLRALLKYLWNDSKTDGFTEELDMCVTDIKYDQVISNDSLSYYFKMQDAREEGMLEGIEKGIEKGIAKGRAEGIAKGRAEGIAKGRAEERLARTLALARSFRDIGVSFDKIAEATGLSEEEIASL